MEIKVDPEDVNRAVAEAIIKSALGTHLEEAITKHLKEAIDGYNSPVKHLCTEHINTAIRKVLEDKYHDRIVAEVAERLSTEHVETIVAASVEKAMDMLRGER